MERRFWKAYKKLSKFEFAYDEYLFNVGNSSIFCKNQKCRTLANKDLEEILKQKKAIQESVLFFNYLEGKKCEKCDHELEILKVHRIDKNLFCNKCYINILEEIKNEM